MTISSATLLSPVSASNLHNVTIFGHSFPTVDCNHTGSLFCENCNNIIIDNIKWIKCGSFNASSIAESSIGKLIQYNNARGLQFLFCINVTIQFCTFIESLVQVFQTSGAISIECVKFLGVDAKFFDYNDTNTYTQSYYEHYYNGLLIDDNNAAVLKVFINNCLFNNAPVSSSVQLLSVKAEIASMQISNTTFDSINGQPLPSIHGNSIVYVSISAEKSDITFRNVTFQSNNVTDNRNILSVFMNENSSTIQLHSCMFSNNTAFRVAVLTARHLTIANSNFRFNNAKSNLISSNSPMSLISNFEELLFSNNFGGPLLSLCSHNISASFSNSCVKNNTLVSGNGLVVVSDYYDLDVLLTKMQFISNNVSTDGSAIYCSSLVMPINLADPLPTRKLVMQNVDILKQHGNGHGAGVYISHQSCDNCSGSYTINQCTFDNISNINSVIYYSASEVSHYNASLEI